VVSSHQDFQPSTLKSSKWYLLIRISNHHAKVFQVVSSHQDFQPSRQILLSGIFPSGFPTDILYTFPIFTKRAACTAHLILKSCPWRLSHGQ
jgi:hypothetical protein